MAITAEVLDITPEIAARLLQKNPHNRKITSGGVKKWAESMMAQRWKVAQPILIDRNGNLLDGQHRLTAVIKTGMTIKMLVIRGWP